MTRFITRSLLTTTTKRSSGPAFRRSRTSLSLSTSRSHPVPTNFPLIRLRYLTAASLRLLTPAHSTAVRAFATRQTSSSLNDPIPNLSNQPPEETILEDDGCDHWVIVMDEPEFCPKRTEIIKSYVQTLASVVGSKKKAREKMYTISTRHYFAFGARISKEIADKIKDLPRVRAVVPATNHSFDCWVVRMVEPDGNLTRDELIDDYIKTLSAVVGSEEEARKKINLVSTKLYFAFGAHISEEIAHRMLYVPRVVGVCPVTAYYGGDPFIYGQVRPYELKYPEEWLKSSKPLI